MEHAAEAREPAGDAQTFGLRHRRRVMMPQTSSDTADVRKSSRMKARRLNTATCQEWQPCIT